MNIFIKDTPAGASRIFRVDLNERTMHLLLPHQVNALLNNTEKEENNARHQTAPNAPVDCAIAFVASRILAAVGGGRLGGAGGRHFAEVDVGVGPRLALTQVGG